MGEAREIIERLGAMNRHALRLAELVSLAVRVESQLLRTARVELLREASAGDEADLWFSDLVEVRTPAGIVFRPEVSRRLREQLAEDEGALEAAWAVTAHVHQHLSPAVFAEEQMAWLALSGAPEQLREVLRSAVRALHERPSGGLAGWVARAMPRLPEEAAEIEEAQMLAAGATWRLRDSNVVARGGQLSEQAAEWASWLAPEDLPRVSFGVRLVENGVEFGPPARAGWHTIELTAANPRIEVSWHVGNERRSKWLRLRPSERQFFEIALVDLRTTEVRLRSVLGTSYRLVHEVPLAPLRPAQKTRPSSQTASRQPLAVHMTYAVEDVAGSREVSLPFVVGVLSELAGANLKELPSLRERPWIDADVHRFDSVMKEIRPRLRFRVENTLANDSVISIDLTFETMQDFRPERVAPQVAPLAMMVRDRDQLLELWSSIRDQPKAEHLIQEILSDPKFLNALRSAVRVEAEESEAVSVDEGEVEAASSEDVLAAPRKGQGERRLLDDLLALARSRESEESILEGLRVLVRDAGIGTVETTSNAARSIPDVISNIDRLISDQLRPILGSPEFRELEGRWRGLQWLVNHADPSQDVMVRVMIASKQELLDDADGSSNWRHSALFEHVYRESFDFVGGQPFGCIVGDYYFDQASRDGDLLESIARVAAFAHAPFLTGSPPSLFGLKNWEELHAIRDVSRVFETSEYAQWTSLRRSGDSQYIAMMMPRFLGRLPYGQDADPVEGFEFEEIGQGMKQAEAGSANQFVWINSAYAMARNIVRAFERYGWPARIRGPQGGAVEGLPVWTYRDADGSGAIKTPTEFVITQVLDAVLDQVGVNALNHYKNSDKAVFFGATSLHAPSLFDDIEATQVAQLSARLPYVLIGSRILHYLKVICRDHIGTYRGRRDMETMLQDWISGYVFPLQQDVDEAVRAKRPLAEATVRVEDVPGEPGKRKCLLDLRPAYQLEELTSSLRFVTEVPFDDQYTK